MYNAIDAQLDYIDTAMRFRREVACCILPEQGIISTTTDHNAGHVDFDWFEVKDRIWKLKEAGQAPDCVYMFHTHPMGYNKMSEEDITTAQAWAMALWIPIWFLVVTEEEVATYICTHNEQKKIERDLLDISKHDTLSVEMQVLVRTMYGMSKAVTIENGEVAEIFKQVQEADCNWHNMHEFHRTREWNQIVQYSE